MSSFDKILELIELNRKFDPFYESKTPDELFLILLDETEECKEEMDKGNYSELESEIGDIFWNFFLLLNKLGDQGKIDKEKVFEKIYKKFSGRKPFLLECRKVSKEEAQILWNEAKRKEGYDESRLWYDYSYHASGE